MPSLRVSLLSLTLSSLAAAGNVCLSTFAVSSLGDAPPDIYFTAFAAGSPCDEGRSAQLTDTISEKWCSIANREPEFQMCGGQATIVNKGEPIGTDKGYNDCGAVLSINSVEYEGRVLDPLGEDNPCGGTCNNGIAFGTLEGLRIYEDVPMCD